MSRAYAILSGQPLERGGRWRLRNLDVVILGGGNAGMGATVATREAELTVAMIEPDLLGGTVPTACASRAR